MIILLIFIFSKVHVLLLSMINLNSRYVYYEKLSEEDRKRTYLFNSFFYTRLTRKGNDDIPNIS